MTERDERHWDDIDAGDDPTGSEDRTPAKAKDDPVEYFGADGEDEGQKLMQNPDGTWGEGQNPAG